VQTQAALSEGDGPSVWKQRAYCWKEKKRTTTPTSTVDPNLL